MKTLHGLVLIFTVMCSSGALASRGAGVSDRTDLDEAVLETNTLAPLVVGTPPSLRVTVGQWMLRGSPPLQLSGGIVMFSVRGHIDVAAAVAVRVQRSEFSVQRWGFELGSILPHKVSGAIDSDEQVQPLSLGLTTYDAHVSSFYEIHAAAIHALPHGNQEWALPEIGLGLSLAHFTNSAQSATPLSGTAQYGGQTYTYSYVQRELDADQRWGISPLVRLGVVLFPQSLMSLRMDVAYVHYANTAHALGQTFDLGASGLMIQEMVQVKL